MLRFATKFLPDQPALEGACGAGFRHAELWLDASLLARWQEVARLARSYPLSYALHFPNSLDLGPETIDHAAALYTALDCRAMVIHQPHFDRFHQALLEREPGLRLGIENHKLSPEDLRAWADRSPGLTLDVEHLWKFTLRDASLDRLLEEVRALLDRWAGKLRHVHLPGYWPGQAEHRPLYCSREMALPVLSLLADAGFEGLVVSEANPEYQTPAELRVDALFFELWKQQYQSAATRAFPSPE